MWTNRGASLLRLQLLDDAYRAPYLEDGVRPVLTLLRDFQSGVNADVVEKLTFFSQAADGTSRTIDVFAEAPVYEIVSQDATHVVFQREFVDRYGNRLQVRKTVSISPGKYHYDVALEFRRLSDAPFDFSCALRGAAGIEREEAQSRYLGTRVAVAEGPEDYKITKLPGAKLAKKVTQTNQSAGIAWTAVVSHYFVAALVPSDPAWISSVTSQSIIETDVANSQGRWGPNSMSRKVNRHSLAQQNSAVVINTVRKSLATKDPLTLDYVMVAAPKVEDILEPYGAGLPVLVEYGLLPSISRIALAILNGSYAVIPNYGVAVLILTVVMRTILHPLTRKSQLSMIKTQKLQPQLQEIQRKCGDDKQKFAQEQMALWRKYGVHPLSGCWPMLLQMPVFIALFGALRAAIELRHAGFLFWIDDLSSPDRVYTLGTFLPVLGNEINVLPILVIVAMFVNQKFTTPQATTDQAKQQQAMMKFMPLFLGFIFYHMPSGLCLYFATSTTIGILERWLVERKAATVELKPVDRKPKRKAGAQGRAEKRSWMDRLQTIVDDQQKTADRTGRKKK